MTTIDEHARFLHWCEVCGLEQELTSDEAFRSGWDWPPNMGAWGIVSPRTCPRCPMTSTVFWAVAHDRVNARDLTPHQMAVIKRIQAELPQGLIG